MRYDSTNRLKMQGVIFEFAILIVLVAILDAAVAKAAPTKITINTSSRVGVVAALAFDFVDGGPPTNSVTISGFATSGVLGLKVLIGDASGSLPGTITLGDNSFFNEFLQNLILGTSFTFEFDTTGNPAGVSSLPDAFSLFVLDAATGLPLFSTSDPTGADAILVFNIGDADPLRVYSPDVAIVPTLESVLSRKIHGGAGTFDLTLASTPSNPTTEPRTGPDHVLVFTFDRAVTGGDASITEGVAIAGAPTFSGNQMLVPLSGVVNQQYVTVAVSNVSSADGGTGGSGSVRVGFLFCDVNQNRVVTVSDLAHVNAQVAQSVNAANFLKDVNASGTLSVTDKAFTNIQITKALPAP